MKSKYKAIEKKVAPSKSSIHFEGFIVSGLILAIYKMFYRIYCVPMAI